MAVSDRPGIAVLTIPLFATCWPTGSGGARSTWRPRWPPSRGRSRSSRCCRPRQTALVVLAVAAGCSSRRLQRGDRRLFSWSCSHRSASGTGCLAGLQPASPRRAAWFDDRARSRTGRSAPATRSLYLAGMGIVSCYGAAVPRDPQHRPVPSTPLPRATGPATPAPGPAEENHAHRAHPDRQPHGREMPPPGGPDRPHAGGPAHRDRPDRPAGAVGRRLPPLRRLPG
ncbi:hypothetical protein HBB16_10640 [Pseudonocardia sp. MCCB 268]|nr:hypothetical protein [Pseudonocardia cytotoxica]